MAILRSLIFVDAGNIRVRADPILEFPKFRESGMHDALKFLISSTCILSASPESCFGPTLHFLHCQHCRSEGTSLSVERTIKFIISLSFIFLKPIYIKMDMTAQRVRFSPINALLALVAPRESISSIPLSLMT